MKLTRPIVIAFLVALVALEARPCSRNLDTPTCLTSTFTAKSGSVMDLSLATVTMAAPTMSGTAGFEDLTVSDDCSVTDDLVAKDLFLGASGIAGSFKLYPATAARGHFAITVANQTGDTAATLAVAAMGQATSVNLSDPGAAASYLAQSTAVLTLGEVDVLQDSTAGTATASKAAILDASAGIAELGIVGVAHVRGTISAALTAAASDLTPAQWRAAGTILIDTTANVVDVEINAALDALDRGSSKILLVSAGGTNAATFTADGAGVTGVVTIQQGTGASCEDVGDFIRVTATGTGSAVAETYCAD